MSLRSSAARLAALCLLLGIALPAAAAELTDSAGRLVVLPPRVGRVMAASPTAEVLVYALAPDKLVGWTRARPQGALPARYARLPVVGRLAGPNPTATAATVTRVHPDLIVDAGTVTPERAAFADQVTQATGTPYIILDNSFARTPTMLRLLGQILGVGEHADDLAAFAEHAINALHGRLLIQPASKRVRVYYGRGPDGLETGLPGSPAAATIDEAGAINVAAPLGRGERARVTREQLLQWNPEVIVAEDRSFYDALRRDPGWRSLAAVRNKRVYLAPSQPFGWIDEPPGVNRLIGLYWLSALLYPGETQEDVRGQLQDFYDKFYGVKLSDKQIEAIAKSAGIPPSDTPHLAALPLTGPAPAAMAPPGRRGLTTPATPSMPSTTPSYLMPR
ncbi:MAG TPA: iron ABC transporter substrate-binding protein [Stellaceae bacterium]|nr:iron ABC transporter substrate-binding protein [Stellaceae bacterium]